MLSINVARPPLNFKVQEFGSTAQKARQVDVDSIMETS